MNQNQPSTPNSNSITPSELSSIPFNPFTPTSGSSTPSKNSFPQQDYASSSSHILHDAEKLNNANFSSPSRNQYQQFQQLQQQQHIAMVHPNSGNQMLRQLQQSVMSAIPARPLSIPKAEGSDPHNFRNTFSDSALPSDEQQLNSSFSETLGPLSLLNTPTPLAVPQQSQSIKFPPSSVVPPLGSPNISQSSAAMMVNPTTPSGSTMIRLREGFNNLVADEQPGGKTNVKDALPRQVVELCIPNVNADAIARLVVKVHVLGYDKSSSSYKVVEDFIGENGFIEMGSGAQKKYVAIFTNLICKHSSHLNGQRLALRFMLYDKHQPNPLSFVDSMDFKTLTKRGTQKRRQKRKKNDAEPQISVTNVYPSMGPATGGLLVKILGNGFSCPPVNNVVVKFGSRIAREVFCIKRNMILCETPEGEPGIVDVKISLDKQTFIPSDAKFTYITIQNAHLFAQQVFQSPPVEHPVQQQPPQMQQQVSFAQSAPEIMQRFSTTLPPSAACFQENSH